LTCQSTIAVYTNAFVAEAGDQGRENVAGHVIEAADRDLEVEGEFVLSFINEQFDSRLLPLVV